MIDLGIVKPGRTLRIPFSSFDKDDGSSVTMTNYAVADILVYKDGSTTERASTAGFTATTDFDAKTGKHLAIIDLADNTTAGFFSAGSEYLVALDAVTIDGVTTGGWIARFTIGYPGAMLDTTIATVTNQTSMTLTDGPAEDNALAGTWAIIHDVASRLQQSRVVITAYTGSTKTITLAAGATFTVTAADNISIMGPAPLQPATAGRTLVVDAAGLADANTVRLGPSGSGTAQTARDIGASVLISSGTGTGQLSVTSGVIAANVTQAAGTAWGSGAITAASIATGALTAAKFAANAIDAAALAADAGTEIATAVWASAARTLTAGTNIVLAKGTGVTGFNDLDAAGVRSAVGLASANLDTQLASISSNALTAAGVRAAVGLAAANLDTQLATIDTVVDAILVDTDVIGAAGAGLTALPWNAAWDAEVQSECDDALIANGLDHLVAAAVTGTDVVDNSIIARMVSKSATADWDSFANTTDSLEALRDRGDAAWTTATGFATHSAADVWAVGTRTLTAGTNIVLAKGTGVTGFNDLDAAGVRSAVGLAAANLDTQLATIDTVVDAIKVKTDALPTWPTNFSALAISVGGVVDANVTAAAGTAWGSGAITAASIATGAITAAKFAANAIDAAALAADAGTEIGTAVWASATRTLTAGTNIVLAKGTGVTGFNDLDAAGVRSAVGLASANLDTQLAAISSGGLDAAGVRAAIGLASANLDTQLAAIDTVVDAILVDTDVIGAAGAGLTALPWNAAWDAEVQSEAEDALNALGFTATVSGRIDAAISSRSTLTAAGVWASGTRTLTSAANITSSGQSISVNNGNIVSTVDMMVAATISAVTNAKTFTLNAGTTDDNAYVGCVVQVRRSYDWEQVSVGICIAFDGATRRVTLQNDLAFYPATNDKVFIFAAQDQNTAKLAVSSSGGVKLADGVDHGGTAATFSVRGMFLTAATGAALTVNTADASAPAIDISGNRNNGCVVDVINGGTNSGAVYLGGVSAGLWLYTSEGGKEIAIGGSLTLGTHVDLRDAVLAQSVAGVEATAGRYTLATAILRTTGKNIRDVDGNTLTTYRTNGSTVHLQVTLGIDPDADPVTEIL